jgi:hypothetical protein
MPKSSLVILPAWLSINKSGRTFEGNDEIGVAKNFYSYSKVTFLHVAKSYDMRPTALLPMRRKACRGFVSSLNMHRLDRA